MSTNGQPRADRPFGAVSMPLGKLLFLAKRGELSATFIASAAFDHSSRLVRMGFDSTRQKPVWTRAQPPGIEVFHTELRLPAHGFERQRAKEKLYDHLTSPQNCAALYDLYYRPSAVEDEALVHSFVRMFIRNQRGALNYRPRDEDETQVLEAGAKRKRYSGSYKDASGSEDEEEDDEQPHSAPMVIDLTKIEAVQSIDLTDDE